MALNRPSEFLTEEDDIMIAPWMMVGVIKSFLARGDLERFCNPPQFALNYSN